MSGVDVRDLVRRSDVGAPRHVGAPLRGEITQLRAVEEADLPLLVRLRAELAISIGETDCWSRGYGTDAIRAVLRHAFETMGLRRIDLHTDADNARGIRCYEKCGFVREGVMRERRLRYGKPLDMVVMGALRHEWEESGGRAKE
jgi:RimJ/RimL family protein N-acetyltransferase